MRYLLDTNSCIYLLTNVSSALTARVAATKAGDVVVSSISLAEIGLGTQRGKPPIQSVLNAFTAEVPVLPFDEAGAWAYARLPFQRGNFDRLIAAHAMSLGLAVITRNVKDFGDVPGLRLEDWTV